MKLLVFLALSSVVLAATASTTVDTINCDAFGANIGWVNFYADGANGAVVGEYVCSGYLYSANIGWINLGSGSPANQIQYQNTTASDFGVNQDGLGNLTGYAWGANIGWVVFEQTYGQPKVNLFNGQFSGYVYSANCGWISLSNAAAYVQSDSIKEGTLAPNGLPIAWLEQNFGTTNVNANADPTGKGYSIQQDYVAGTDPNNASDVLKITLYQHNELAPFYNLFNWNAKPTRFYAVQCNANLSDPAGWLNCATFSFAGVGATAFYDYNPTNQFYRVLAYRPLMP
jgi:hypothetical protein